MQNQHSSPSIERFLLPVAKLSHEKDQMFFLFNKHFEGVTREQFEKDLSSKDWAILLTEEKILKGFSTFQFYETKFKDEFVRIVYSGDTITDPSIWNSPALAQAWIKAIKLLHQENSKKLYWLLISSGYRTYRFMSVCWREFYPCYNRQTPDKTREFIDHLAQVQFKECYDSHKNIVRFSKPQVLRPHLRNISSEKLKNPHITFFVEKNPNHGQGDELVCLTQISKANLTRAGLRIWQNEYSLSMPFPITSS